jgi:hypothetical protein
MPYAPAESAVIALLLILATAITLTLFALFDTMPNVERVITLDLPALEHETPG